MTDNAVTDNAVNETTEASQPVEETAAVPMPREKTPIVSGAELRAIVPTSYEDAYRMAVGFVRSGLLPESYSIKRNAQGKEVKSWEDGTFDEKATCARVALGIMKGLEIGIPPVSAIGTIMIVNNRPCLWGDGAVALVQRSGKVEYMKDWTEGVYGTDTFIAHFEVKRKDNEVAIRREFGFKDAKSAGLTGKKGPWSSGYGPRMCFNRARAWALRDGFSDVLMGIGIVEEVQDMVVEAKRNAITDTSSLDDSPKQIEHAPEKPAAEVVIDEEKIAAERAAQE
jgi:hypothetical protein